MSVPSFIYEDTNALDTVFAPGSRVRFLLSVEEYHHMRVLRIVQDECVRLVHRLSPRAFEVTLTEDLKSDLQTEGGLCPLTGLITREISHVSSPCLTLIPGISRGERFEQVIRQTTELGVERIIPLVSERCIVKIDKKKIPARMERWRSIACSAAKQSGRLVVPCVDEPKNLSASLDAVKECDVLIVPWEEAENGSVRNVLMNAYAEYSARYASEETRHLQVALFVGPEGGFTAAEVDIMRSRGGQTVTLGPTILRTETAGVVAAALVLHELGGLGNEND